MITTLSPERSSNLDSKHDALPHILLVVDQLLSTLGGGERIILKIASLLPEYGYNASILTFAAHPESPALQSPPCPIYLLPLQSTYNLTALRGAFELRRFLKQQHIQIVHTFFESSDIWAGFVTKTMSKAKLIWSRRDMGILRSNKHHISYRLMSGMPDAVFTVSELVRQHSIDIDHIDPARVQTVYNGLNISDWAPTPRPAKTPGEFHITTAGNIRPVKGHDLFIEAAAAIVPHFPNASFSIAGEVLEPDYFEQLQALVRTLGLSGHFQFVGSVKDIREHLSTADVFVLPSRSEGFSNAIVEAMAASLPVVATNVGGNAEAVQDGVTGFIVPPEDPEALADAISRLLSNPARAKEMGAAGKNLAAEKFTTEAMMSQIAATYSTLLATP